MGKYDAVAKRTLATIKRKGGTATFYRGGGNTNDGGTDGDIYDPLTDRWTDDVTPPVSGGIVVPAVQIQSDPERYEALGLKMAETVSLIAAAQGYEPEVGHLFKWGGKTYTIAAVEATAPDGITPVFFQVDGSA